METTIKIANRNVLLLLYNSRTAPFAFFVYGIDADGHDELLGNGDTLKMAQEIIESEMAFNKYYGFAPNFIDYKIICEDIEK